MKTTSTISERLTLLKRSIYVSLLVLGLATVARHASAHFQIPAIAGNAANAYRMGGTYWEWGSDGYVRRKDDGPSVDLYWYIPLPFHQTSEGSNTWSVSVVASQGTMCSLQWRDDHIPDQQQAEGTTEITQDRQGGGQLILTSTDLCPEDGPAQGCTTVFSTAFVACLIPQGGFLGAVTYNIDAAPFATH
jgi:hypothetical protein